MNMETTAQPGTTGHPTARVVRADSEALLRSSAPRDWSTPLAVLVTFVLFVADLFIPRGATPAIGYALVPVLAGGSRKRSAVLGTTALCAVLTVAGYFLEAPGAAWWTSAFDRLALAAVLAVTALLVLRRLTLIASLAERTEAVERAAEELARSNAELDRFTSRVAHDLRGPLNGVGLVTQVLASRSGGTADPESAELAESARVQIERMSQLIQRLLAYGRVGGRAMRLSDCDCEAVLAAVLRALAPVLADGAATVTHDPLPVVRADPVLVSELFQNLVENAVKYRGDRAAKIHVRAAAGERGHPVFSVRDNGVGIRPDDVERIFRPFTQLGTAGTAGGVGLGLATSRRIVERHGGTIWVESAPGEGSTFFFTLGPVATTLEAQRLGTSSARAPALPL
jgi:signal transduction histidine kinase